MNKPMVSFCAALSFACFTLSTHALQYTFTATMDGPSEAPPNDSPGTGSALVIYDNLAHTLFVSASFADLVGTTTAAHIHAPTAVAGTGTAGVATQVPNFAGFPLGVTSGTFANTFDLTMASSFNPAFVTAQGGVTAAEVALVNALFEGKAYFNVHTTYRTGGEIRGFLNRVPDTSTTALLLVPVLLGVVAWARRTGLAGPIQTRTGN